MRPKFAILIAVLPGVIAACSRSDIDHGRDAKSTIEAQSRLAATQEQKRLWQAVAGHTSASGLDKLPLVENPVAPRLRVTVQDRRVQAQPSGFPKDLIAGVEVISAPQLPEARFTGVAQVARIEGERVDLELGERRIMSLRLRAGSIPLRILSDETVGLDYRLAEDPSGHRAIVAVRIQNGDGVASAVESGRAPIAFQVPLFDLSAMQVGRPEKDAMNVEVRVGKERKVLPQGVIAEFPTSRLTVGVVASVAHAAGQATETEGNPYALRILVWRTR